MRIGCLQFAPVKGDVDHNLSRADAVLCKANPDGLDLLVLPELAFAGHGFNSVDEIYPYSEPTCAGVTALWARTAALKFECTVVAGYAERVSSRSASPRGPEHYNSAIMVNADDETIANYRKCYLQASDENWACEGQDGFYENLVMGIGQVAMGLSMDINPYRFEEPWENFDFAFHIMDVEANVVIVTMSWPTNEDKRAFSRLPTEPDTNTLMFWISRLEPLIRAEKKDEVIVIFCNRCGIDGDTCFSGTSTVLGIVDGEVRVYGLLGRGVKELLVVDTYNPPFGRLVYRPDDDTVKERAAQVQAFMPGSYHAVKQGANVVNVPADSLRVLDSLNVDSSTFRSMHHSMETLSIRTGSGNGTSSKSHTKIPTPVSKKPPIPLSVKTSGRAINQLSAVAPSFPTPSAPSPTPMGMRPRLTVPPVDSLTYRYVESQGHGMVLTPHPEIPQSPKIIDGRVNINFGSTLGSAVEYSMPPTSQTWPDLHPIISIPAFHRPGSSKSDATLFSDWIESDYNSQYSVENNNRVMSGTNALPRECERDRDNFSTIARLNARVRSNSGTGSSGRGFNDPDTPISPVEQTSTKFCRKKSNSRADLRSQIERSTSAVTEDFYQVSKLPMVELPSPLITRTGKTPQPFAAIRPMAASNLWMGDYRYERMNDYYGSSPSGLRQTRPRHERGDSLVKRVSISKTTKDGGSRSSSQVNESRGRRSTRVNSQKLTTGGSRDRKRSGSRKLDLSQFRMIEEYQSPNCPVHGRAAKRRASSENRGEFDRERAKSRSYSTGVINGPPPLPDTRSTNRENNKVGVIDHSEPHSRLPILPPLKTGNIPELTNESLEKHTTPVKPWVEVWMPPLSRSVPPSSLGQRPVPAKAKVQSPKPITSPRPEAGRVTPRAMVLINVDSAGASGPGSEPTYKCMDRPTIVDSVVAN